VAIGVAVELDLKAMGKEKGGTARLAVFGSAELAGNARSTAHITIATC